MSKELQHLGERLEAARLEAGLSVGQLKDLTHIPAPTIAALESGDPALLPDRCFLAGFVRSYCHALGLRHEPYLALLHTHGGTSPNERRDRLGQKRRAPVSFALPRIALAPEALSWIAVVVVLAAAWTSYTLLFKANASPDENTASAATVELRLPK
jgi:cytoskeleton protein RodZ